MAVFGESALVAAALYHCPSSQLFLCNMKGLFMIILSVGLMHLSIN